MAVSSDVAALAQAGNDTDALAKAIKNCSHLDATPGEDRQKLRDAMSYPPRAAARTKLKKLIKEAEEKAKKDVADASSKGPTERSPHAKESYDIAEFDALAAKYEQLNWRMLSKPGGATVKPDSFYTLYGLAKQATEGANKEERPMWAEKGGIDFDGRSRWDAWDARKGMATDAAKQQFVKEYYEFLPKSLYKDER